MKVRNVTGSTPPLNIQRWSVATARLSVFGACLWFVLTGMFYFTEWRMLPAILAALTCVQAILSIAVGAVLHRLRRWPDTPQRRNVTVAFAFGLLPIIIAAGVIIAGWILILSG